MLLLVKWPCLNAGSWEMQSLHMPGKEKRTRYWRTLSSQPEKGQVPLAVPVPSLLGAPFACLYNSLFCTLAPLNFVVRMLKTRAQCSWHRFSHLNLISLPSKVPRERTGWPSLGNLSKQINCGREKDHFIGIGRSCCNLVGRKCVKGVDPAEGHQRLKVIE